MQVGFRDPLVAKLKDPRAATIPCPVLRALANEGRLTPGEDGLVDVAQLKKALGSLGVPGVGQFILASAAQYVETQSLLKMWRADEFSLYKLQGSGLDHKGDMQVMRHGFDRAHLDRLLSFSSDGERLTVNDLAKAQRAAWDEERPGLNGAVLGIGEMSAVLLVFGTRDALGVKGLKKQDLIALYEEAKLPEGFQGEPVNPLELVAISAKLAYQQIATTAGRAKASLDKALGRMGLLDQTSMLGLKNAVCPAGMKPSTKTPPVSTREVVQIHQGES